MPKSWYKKNIDEALEPYLSSDDFGNVVTAIASPIYPSNSAQDVRKKNDGSQIPEAVNNKFNQEFPFSQLASGNGACYFNASFAAILHDCVGDAAKWKKFRQGLENLFAGASFEGSSQIADFIAQIDEGMEFPTREKVNEVLGVTSKDNIVTKMSKTLLVDIYGPQFVKASKEFLVGEAATYDLKWNGTSGLSHQQQWNDLIDEYVNLRGIDESTFTTAGERQRLTEALDVRKNALIKGIMSDQASISHFWTHVVETNAASEDKWMLEYGLQNLRLYQTAFDTNTLAATYDGNQMKPFFDMLYPGVEIVAITNNGMERSMNTDGHPKAGTIYLYNPDGRSHFSVLHADLDGRIAADIAREETVALPRNPYVTDVASVPLPRPNSDAFTFTAEQVKAAVKNSRINEANEYEDPIAYAIANFDSEIIWALAVERASNHPYDQDGHISAIQGKIDSLDAINQSVEIESLKSLVDYMLQVNASLEPKSLQMGAKLRAQSAPSSILLFDDKIEEFPKFDDAAVSIYAPKWVEGTLKKLSDRIQATYPDGISITIAATDQTPEHQISLGYTLTLHSLQMLARNEQVNTNGEIDGASYGGLHPEIIKDLKDLVRQVVIIGKDKATGFGGYDGDYEDFEYEGAPNPKDVYVIDLSGIQFQQKYNTGRLFVHPKYPTEENLIGLTFDDIAEEIFKNVTGKVWSEKTVEEMEDHPDKYLDYGSWCLDKEAYQAFVREDFTFAAESLAATLGEANETRPVNFKFLQYGLGYFADKKDNEFAPGRNDPRLTKQFVIGALQGANEFLDQRGVSEEASPLRKIQAIELPFCEIARIYGEALDEDSKTIMTLYHNALDKIEEQEMLFVDDRADCLSPLQNGAKEYITATTNCADPHVVMGNEMGYASVDAMIAQNLVGKGRTFSPYLNGKMKEKYLEKSSFRAATPPDIKLSEDQKKYKELKAKLIKFFYDGQLGVKCDDVLRYVGEDGKIVTYNTDLNNELSVENPQHGLIKKQVDDEKPVELSLEDLEKELIVLSKVIAEKTPAPKTANPKPATSKPKAKKSSTKFSNEEIRVEFVKYSKEESKKEVSERQIGEGLRTKVKAIAESGTEFLVKEGGDGQAISAKEAAKEKLRDFANNHVTYKEGTDKGDFLDKLAEYSAKGVAVKAVKASFNDKVEKQVGKTEIDQEAFSKMPKDHQRHMRISFKGVYFGNAFLNSFANCEFDGDCNFSDIAASKNKFANCTFGETCTPQQAKELAKLGPDNLYGCKFSEEFIEKLGDETEQQKFKDALKISGDVVDGFYKSADKKPDSKFEPISAFKIKEVQQARAH